MIQCERNHSMASSSYAGKDDNAGICVAFWPLFFYGIQDICYEIKICKIDNAWSRVTAPSKNILLRIRIFRRILIFIEEFKISPINDKISLKDWYLLYVFNLLVHFV